MHSNSGPCGTLWVTSYFQLQIEGRKGEHVLQTDMLTNILYYLMGALLHAVRLTNTASHIQYC